MELMIIVTYR